MAKVIQITVICRDNWDCTAESSMSPDRFDVGYIHSGAIYIHNKLIIIIVVMRNNICDLMVLWLVGVGVSLTEVELVELYFSTIIW